MIWSQPSQQHRPLCVCVGVFVCVALEQHCAALFRRPEATMLRWLAKDNLDVAQTDGAVRRLWRAATFCFQAGRYSLVVGLHSTAGKLVSHNSEAVELFTRMATASTQATKPHTNARADPRADAPNKAVGVINSTDGHATRRSSGDGAGTAAAGPVAAVPLSPAKLLLVDTPEGATAAALSKLGFTTEPLVNLAKLQTLDTAGAQVVIGENAWSASVDSDQQRLSEWVRRGGRYEATHSNHTPPCQHATDATWRPFDRLCVCVHVLHCWCTVEHPRRHTTIACSLLTLNS